MKHTKRVILIVVAVLMLIGVGAFLWKLIGPTGSLVPKYRTFSTYEGLATDYADPVFEAYSTSDEAKQHSVEYANLRLQDCWGNDVISSVCVVLDSADKIDREYTSEEISLDRTGSAIGLAPTTIYFYPRNDTFSQSDDVEFRDAESFGVRADYVVDGTTVQKFYERDVMVLIAEQQVEREPDEPLYLEDLEAVKAADFDFWERVFVNNRWYYVVSEDEATADSVATALAQIAVQM